MRDFPIDVAVFQKHVMSFVEVVPVVDKDEKSSTFEQQRLNHEGVPQWELRFLTRDPEDVSRRPEMTVVKLAAHVEPKVSGKPVLEGLKARAWSMNGSSGVALSCTGIVDKAAKAA